MPLGDIQYLVELDEPGRVYYGSSQAVSGHILLEYKKKFGVRKDSHHDQTPLFGPLKLELRFQGRLIANADDRTGASTTPSHSRVLFTKTMPIYDGSFQAEAGDRKYFPFSISFPDRIQPRTEQHSEAFQGEDGNWRFNTSHHVEDDCPLLPPSFHTDFTAKRLGDRSSISIEYMLDALVELPGIEVRVTPSHKQCRVRYEQTRLNQPPLAGCSFFGANLNVTGTRIGTEVTERLGFRARAKSLLSSRDTTYNYQLACSRIPNEICQDQKISCDVEVGLISSTTDDVPQDMPMLKVDSFEMKIVQFTTLIAEDTGKPIANDVQIVQALRAPTEDLVFYTSGEKHHLSTVEPVHGYFVPSSFATQNLNRIYKLRLEIQVSSCGQTRLARKDVPLIVHPPILQGHDEQDRLGSSRGYHQSTNASGRPILLRMPSESLPSYDDATADLEMPPLDEYVEHRNAAVPG